MQTLLQLIIHKVTLLIGATGNNGTITVSHASMIKIYPVNSFVTIRVSDSNFTSSIITTNTITYETSSCSTLPFEFAITIMIVGTVATILVLRFREKNQRKTCSLVFPFPKDRDI